MEWSRLFPSTRLAEEVLASYSPEYLDGLAATLRAALGSGDAWCVLDNTASGAALENALELSRSSWT